MILDELANWATWADRDWSGAPDIPGNWDLIVAMEFKNCYESTEEKLERLQQAQDRANVDQEAAARMERWVVQMAEPMRSAIRIEWIDLPEYERVRWRQTHEQWQLRKARFLNHRLRQRLPGCFHIRDAGDFEEAVTTATNMLDRALTLHLRAA